MARIVRLWREQHGSQALQAAAAALVAALLVSALLGSLSVVQPALERALSCAAAVLSGSPCPAGAAPGTPEAGLPPDAATSPWWQALVETLQQLWEWLVEHVFKPLGALLGQLWDWLWQEREATWWRRMLEWLRAKGLLGWLAAAGLGFLGEFLFGVASDGTFTWGGVGISVILTVLAFVSGGLTKIPALVRLAGKGRQVLAWLRGSRLWRALADSRVGKWLAKRGAEHILGLLEGRFGTLLHDLLYLGPLLQRHHKWLERVPFNKLLRPAVRDRIKRVGDYAWYLVKDGPFGLAKELFGKLMTEWGPLKRLNRWKAWQELGEWLREPKLPWPFSR